MAVNAPLRIEHGAQYTIKHAVVATVNNVSLKRLVLIGLHLFHFLLL